MLTGRPRPPSRPGVSRRGAAVGVRLPASPCPAPVTPPPRPRALRSAPQSGLSARLREGAAAASSRVLGGGETGLINFRLHAAVLPVRIAELCRSARCTGCARAAGPRVSGLLGRRGEQNPAFPGAGSHANFRIESASPSDLCTAAWTCGQTRSSPRRGEAPCPLVPVVLNCADRPPIRGVVGGGGIPGRQARG